ncbi:MAG: efflux RND transporter permease subunit [Pseudomonadota bacterium]
MNQLNWYESIITWFARNPVAANLLMAVLLLGGLYTAATIKKELNPRLEINVIQVRVEYLGAGPLEVEKSVCVKLEEALQDLVGITELACRAYDGVGVVSVDVDPAYDMAEMQDEVQSRVDNIATFPEQTERPVVTRARFEQPVMWLSVYGDVSERTLYEYAKTLRDDMLALPKITRVEVIGARPYEISLEVSEDTLQGYNITFDELTAAVRRSSLDLPGGAIRTDSGDVLLRATGQAYVGRDFEKLVVRTNRDGTRVLLSDVARVRDGFEEVEAYSQHNGKQAIAVRVLSVGQQSELELGETVRNYVQALQAELPDGISVDYWADVTYYLDGRLDMMVKNLLSGAILVFLVLTLFLRLKLAFWVMVGLPVAFMGAFFVMPAAGVTINMTSLFGFILVLGIVVDDAIVIGESAYTHIRRDGHSEASVVDGVLRVAIPATFGVLTTMAAFFPILTIDGVFGQFLAPIGWVVVLCLAFSLVESKLILPAHLVHMKLPPPSTPEQQRSGTLRQRVLNAQRKFSDGLKRFAERRYVPLLKAALRQRYTTLALFLGMLIISVGLLMAGFVRTVLLPEVPGDYIQADLLMAEGTPPRQTQEAMDRVQRALWEVDTTLSQRYGMEPGSVVGTLFAFTDSDVAGTMIVELKRNEGVGSLLREVTEGWRERAGEIAGARYLSFSDAGGPNAGADISFQLVGRDRDLLARASKELEAKVRSYAGVFDVRNSLETGGREIKLRLKPEAEALGLTLQDLARQVRQGFYGEEVQRVQRGSDEVKVMLRYPKAERDSVGYLEQMRVRTADGDAVPFASVATVEYGRGPIRILRFDRQRAVSVTAEVDTENFESWPINQELRDKVIPEILSRYPGVQYVLSGGLREAQRLTVSIVKGSLVALFLIYALMAIPLRSYAQPLLIMSVIPFGVIGAIFGHWLLGDAISIISAFGIIALAGVVVNDSLILVDYINRRVREGMALQDAIVAAGARRFRPILLTSMTTFLGLAPIVFFEKSLQAAFIIPMATSLAFGIVFATVITLFLIPTLCLVLDDVKNLFHRAPKPLDSIGASSDPAG